MKLQSLIREQDKLVPAEVEVHLLPGLPQIHILGLPDQVIKESMHRVKCALKMQGFDWPKARQIVVNIRPVHRKKNSGGLELAIAAGILWETRQKPTPENLDSLYVYGEVGLSGEVWEPDDLCDFLPQENAVVLTGKAKAKRGFARECISNLQELDQTEKRAADLGIEELKRPNEGTERLFTEHEARVLSLAALGEHHLLLAGASGGGKSTLAKSLPSFLRSPDLQDLREGRVRQGWRPWSAPHHTISALSMTGGTVPPKPGEITKAHGGILFLDELLEFDESVQEALREPVEEGVIRIHRGLREASFPARFQMIATTNLCPCGQWVPGRKIDCGRNWRRCRSVLERLSGPFLDRFEMLIFVSPLGSDSRTVSGKEILERLEKVRHRKPSWDMDSLWGRVAEPWRTELKSSVHFPSERRRNATLRVAATLADLDGLEKVGAPQIEEALEYCLKNFERLRTSSQGC